MNQALPSTSISSAELVDLCAVDDDLFARTFFPQAMRQPTPRMHEAVDKELNNPQTRLLNLLLPRDFAKTTKLRIFTAKRIAYGISRTILYIASSEIKATQNIQWLKSRIEPKLGADGTRTAPMFASLFGLAKGEKWSETELKINHRLFGQPIWVRGVGITSESIRGINFDDYRPDLIVLDDILTDENGASPEQREKINQLVISAVKNSLAPPADAPNAKMVMANTPQDGDDVTARAAASTEWRTVRFSCWTPETEDAPVELQESAWPERHTTDSLRKEKRAAAAENTLSVFIREKECRVVSRETCFFRPDWLRFYTPEEAPRSGVTILSIDPVPPPTPGEEKKKKASLDTDFESMQVWRRYGDNFYLLALEQMRGHQPSWTIAKFFELAVRFRIANAIVETVAYQKVLRWLLQEEMTRRQHWVTIQEWPFPGQARIQSKKVRIQNVIAPLAQNGRIFVSPEHTEFIAQFGAYPNVKHDDALDGGSMALAGLSKPWMDVMDDEGVVDNTNVPKLRLVRNCP